jgi:hypothetical protein
MAKKKKDDPFKAIRDAGTNGDNYDVSTKDIIDRLKKWQKSYSFRIKGADYNELTLKFEELPTDIRAFLEDAADLCPDLVQIDEDVDFPLLEKQLAKTKKLKLWWD